VRKAGCSKIELDSAFHQTDAREFYWQQRFENRAYMFSKSLQLILPSSNNPEMMYLAIL
jgi:hypothetical protein